VSTKPIPPTTVAGCGWGDTDRGARLDLCSEELDKIGFLDLRRMRYVVC
jgi:hypothetical protein